jgi:Flp pilus assembly pilin Flp
LLQKGKGRDANAPAEKGSNMRQRLHRLVEERGQGLAEYAILISFLLVGVIAAVGVLNGNVREALSSAAAAI